MKRFVYKAKKGPKEIVTGVLEAEKREDVTKKLAGSGLFVFQVEEEAVALAREEAKKTGSRKRKKAPPPKPSVGLLERFRNSRVSQKDIFDFTTQLASLFRSQIDILTALQILRKESSNPKMIEVIQSIESSVEDGDSLSSALTQFPDYFPLMYRDMIEAGENSGKLEHMLDELAKAADKDEVVKSKVMAALAYPFLMMAVGVITIFVLLTFVIPRLMVVFEDLQIELPTATKVLINTGNFMQQYWWIVILFVCMLVVVFRSKKGQSVFKGLLLWVKFKIPYFRKIFIDASIVRFCRTLALLLKSGIPLLKALKLTSPLVESPQMIEELEGAYDSVVQGSGFAEGLEGSRFLPSRALHMVAVGERGGRLEEVLEEIAHGYERSMDERMKVISSLIEPLIILFLGLVVGFILWAVLSPIFQMSTLGA